jgi:precorrin-6B methylase 2
MPLMRQPLRGSVLLLTFAVGACGHATPVPVTPAPPPPAAAAAPSTPPSTAAAAAPQEPAGNEAFVPTVGQEGKDVVWVPTSPELVELMLDMAKVTPQDFVMDLGSGDGRNIIAAAKRGAQALGVEYNPDMVALSRRQAREAGVADRAQFVQGDMYVADISKATVLALFLLPQNLEQLKDNFLALPPGTRIVLNTFTLDGWEPADRQELRENCTSWCTALLLLVPARMAGNWQFDGGRLELTQEYESLSGTLTREGAPTLSVTGNVRAAEFTLRVDGRTYTGRVDNNRITGTVTETGGATRQFTGSR